MKKYFVGMIVLVLVVIPAAGCAGADSQVPNNLQDVVITLERTACFGICPVYKLTVYGNGEVVYEGERFVKIEGRRTDSISEEKIRQLVSEFLKIDYFSLKDRYEERMATDLPSAITSITMEGKTKTTRHYHGDYSAPEELTELEDRIDEIVNSQQWIK
jgi:hypothetical protein